MDVPDHVLKLLKTLQHAKGDVEKQRQYLQLDRTFTFQSKDPLFADRPLKFKKLRNNQITQIQSLLPNIVEGQDLTAEESNQLYDAAATTLALASEDNISIDVFRDLEGPFLLEAFHFCLDIIGWTKASAESLGWFRNK